MVIVQFMISAYSGMRLDLELLLFLRHDGGKLVVERTRGGLIYRLWGTVVTSHV